MTGLLIGPDFARRFGDRIDAIERDAGVTFERILVPEDPAARLPEVVLEPADAAVWAHRGALLRVNAKERAIQHARIRAPESC